MKKIIVLILALIFISCSNKIDKNAVKESTKPVIDIATITKNIAIDGAIECENISLPIIKNRIIGIEDDDVSNKILSDDIRQTFSGLHVELLPKSSELSEVTIQAVNGKITFSKKIKLNKKQSNDDVLEGYYCNVNFENKYWLQIKDWEIQIIENNNIIISKKISFGAKNEILYKNVSDDPFVIIDERNPMIGKKYTFRFDNSLDEKLIAIYWNKENDDFVPVKILSSNNKSNICDVSVSWKDNTEIGTFLVTAYNKDKIPSTIETRPLFDSRWVHE